MNSIFYNPDQEEIFLKERKNYVSINFKGFKGQAFYSLKYHNNRKLPPKSLLPSELIKFDNFEGEFDTFQNLQKRHREIMKKKGRSVQKNQRLIFEGVLAFSADQIEANGDPKIMEEHIRNYITALEEKTGMKSIGYYFHSDEGYPKGGKKPNYHCHIQFYNFDFEKEQSVQMNLSRQDFREFQDMAGQHFSKFGFKRGIQTSKPRKHYKHQEWKLLQDENTRLAKENEQLKEETAKYKGKFQQTNKDVEEAVEYVEGELQTATLQELEALKDKTQNVILKRFCTYAIRGLKKIDSINAENAQNAQRVSQTLDKFLKGQEMDYTTDFELLMKIFPSLEPLIGKVQVDKIKEEAFKLSNKRKSSEADRAKFDRFKK